MVVSSGKNTRSEPSAQYLPGIVHAREPPYGQTCVPPTQGTPPPYGQTFETPTVRTCEPPRVSATCHGAPYVRATPRASHPAYQSPGEDATSRRSCPFGAYIVSGSWPYVRG